MNKTDWIIRCAYRIERLTGFSWRDSVELSRIEMGLLGFDWENTDPKDCINQKVCYHVLDK